MGIGLIIFLWTFLVGPANASDVPWYIGQQVAEVEIRSQTDTRVRSDFTPILRVKPGSVLDAGSLRSDVSLLVRAGGFAAVEAYVEAISPPSEVGPIRVVYLVVTAPRVRSIKVRGASDRVAKRAVLSSLGVDLGDPWFGVEDESALVNRVVKRLRSSGWTKAEVRVESTQEEGAVELVIRVSLNAPQVVSSIRVGGKPPVSKSQVLKWIRKGGVKRGRRVDRESEESARKRILSELRKRGWDRARVNLFTRDRTEANEVQITALITPGSQLLIEASGRKLPNRRILRDSLGIRAGDRITENIRQDAERRLADWYAGKGFLDAMVNVETEQVDETVSRLNVIAKPGPRYWVRGVQWPTDAVLKKRDMMGVLVEAAPDTIGDRVLTQSGVNEVEVALAERFAADGYLDALVTMDIRKGRQGWVALPFRFGVPVKLIGAVELGPQIRLDALVVRGGVGIEQPLVEQWRQEFEGLPLNAAAAARLEKAIVDAYEANGYLDVETELQTVRNRVQDTAVVDIGIKEGEQVHLRSIVIRGNRRTQRKVIEREIMLGIGEPIAAESIAETRNNLYNLDLFRLVSPELIGEEVGSQDLILRLEERANILMEAGGGVSTDEGVRTTGRVTHRNLGGLGHRLTTLGTIGYGWFGDEWTLDTASPVWRAATRYELPYIPGRGGRLVMEGLIHETIQEPTWRLSRSGGAIGLKMRLSKRAEAVVDYRVQLRRLVDVDPGSLVNGDPWLPYLGLSEDLSGDPVLESGARVVSGGSLLLVHDARDDRFNPKTGTLWSTHVEVGDAIFSGDVTLRATAKLEQLIPIGPFVLDVVGRGGVGLAQGRRSTLPLEERFFLGGGTTLRGFSTNSVGPANFARRPEINHPTQTEPVVDGLALYDNSGQWAATGGDAMAAATVEFRVPLHILGFRRLDKVDWVFFSDVGHVGFLDSTVVTTSRLEESDPLLRSSVGTGIRFATPVGPASLDVGFNTSPIRERNEPWVLPHLTLGVL